MAKDCPPAIDGATVAAVDRLSHALNCVGDALVALDGDALLSAEVDLSAATASVAVGPDAGDRHALLDAVRRARFALLRCRRLGHRLPACRAPWAASAGSATDTTARAACRERQRPLVSTGQGLMSDLFAYRRFPVAGGPAEGLAVADKTSRTSTRLVRDARSNSARACPSTLTARAMASISLGFAERADLLEAQLRHELPAQGREAAMADSLSQLRPPLAVPAARSIRASRFFNAFSQLAEDPTSGVAGNR